MKKLTKSLIVLTSLFVSLLVLNCNVFAQTSKTQLKNPAANTNASVSNQEAASKVDTNKSKKESKKKIVSENEDWMLDTNLITLEVDSTNNWIKSHDFQIL